MRLSYIFLLLLLPYSVNAGVSISEVAWMGDIESANYEWIELNNDGAETDVSGWTLSDGMNLNIELSGVIPANHHAVLERTSDASAVGTAFLIYTGALVNTGATLILKKSDGSLVDQVAGGDNWVNIGGDNTTKETAQYTSSGWKTSVATPGSSLVWNSESEADNTDVPSNDGEDTTEKTETIVVKKSSGSSETVSLTLPGVTLALEVDSQTVGYVNQTISFTVEASGIGDSLIDSLVYQWNFGDGTTAQQKDVQHSFQYPGTYVVTVYGGFKRQEQVGRHEITILPVEVTLTTNRAGDVQINNNSPYELDISGYRLVGEKTFIFPPYTILLPNQTITIPKNKVGKYELAMIGFYDTETTLLSSLMPGTLAFAETSSLPTLKPQISAISLSHPIAPATETNFTFSPTPVASVSELENESGKEPSFITTAIAASSTQLANANAAVPEPNSRMGYLALAGVLGLGILGVYAKPRRNEMS